MSDVQLLQALIDQKYGGSQAAFARAIDRQPAQVNQYIKGRRQLGIEAKLHIEQATNSQGLFSVGPQPSIQTQNVKLSGVDAVDLSNSGGVPLISWVQAGSWADVADPHLVGEADDWLPCPVRHGPRTYCLKVRGDSMHNPAGRPSYADGDIIFVDPDRPANPGDRVIVRLDDHAEATFKQLLIEDGRKLLKALNPEWAPRYIEINGNATIAGVIIGKWVPE